MNEEPEVAEESEFDAAFSEIAATKELEEAEKPEEKPEVDPELDPKEEIKDSDPEPEIDIYEGMSEAAKTELAQLKTDNEALDHRLKSDAGRVSAFQRKVNTLEGEIQTIRKTSATEEQPSVKDIAGAMTGTDDDWEQFKTDYPEIAGTIDKRLEQAGEATQESIDNTLAPVMESQERAVEQEHETAKQQAVDVVAEDFPTWTEAVKTTDFNQWLDDQPPGISALSSSDDVKDASALIGMYDSYLVANDKPSLRKETPTPDLASNEAPETKTALERKREQQLEAGTTVKSKSARIDPSAGESMSEFDQAFDVFAKRREAQRRTA